MTDIFIILALIGLACALGAAGFALLGPVGGIRLALRYFRTHHVTLLSVLGLGVGLAVVLVIKSVVSGLVDELNNRFRAVSADLVIYHPFDEATLEALEKLPGVSAVDGQLEAQVGIIRIGPDDDFTIKQCQVVGIDPRRTFAFGGLRDYLKTPEGTKYEGMWILGGQSLFSAPDVAPGDVVKLQLAYQAADKTWPRTRPEDFTVAGLVDTGLYEIDRAVAYVPLEFMQKSAGGGRFNSTIRLRLGQTIPADKFDEYLDQFLMTNARSFDRILPMWDGRYNTYRYQYAPYLRSVEDQGEKLILITVMIIVVSAVCVLATVIMITLQKIRDIGILRAVGASRRTVMGAFLGYALLVALAGGVFGVGLTALALWKIDLLKAATIKLTGYDPISKRLYTDEKLPYDWKAPTGESRLAPWLARKEFVARRGWLKSAVDFWGALARLPFVVTIPAAAVGLVVLGASLPAYLAARRDPVKSILYE